MTQRDGVWWVDDTLRLAIVPVFPHRRRWGFFWRIAPPAEPVDVIVAVAVSHDGPTEQLFVARGDQLTHRARGLFLRIETANTTRFAASLGTVGERLAQLRYTAGSASEARLLSAARANGVTNFSALARELAWPPHAVRTLYWKLIAHGEWMPPLKYRAGRLVEIVCAQCDKTRWERPNRSDLCFDCTRMRPRHRLTVTCPACGRTAERWPSAVKQLSNGAATVCRLCRAEAGLNRRKTPGPATLVSS